MISIQNAYFLSIDINLNLSQGCHAVTSFLTLNNLVLWSKVEAEGMFTTPEVLGVSPLLVTCHTEHVVTLCCDEQEGGTMVTKHMMLEPAHREIMISSTLLHFCLCESRWEFETYYQQRECCLLVSIKLNLKVITC